MIGYRSKPLKRYVNDLAARIPAPGGGSASALCGALGTALLSMVANYTLGKQKYKDVESQMKRCLSTTEELKERLMELVDLDVVAFKKRNLREATTVPLEVCKCCSQGLKMSSILLKKGNRNLLTDVRAARILFKAGMDSALLNIKVNLPRIKNKKFVRKLKRCLQNY